VINIRNKKIITFLENSGLLHLTTITIKKDDLLIYLIELNPYTLLFLKICFRYFVDVFKSPNPR